MFAVPLGEVREVVVVPPIFTLVPRAPEAVQGVINLRGRIVTVVDFARLLGLPPANVPADSTLRRVVLLEGGLRDLGVLVDEVSGIRELEREAPPPPGSPPEALGLSRTERGPVTLLAAEPLLAAVRRGFEASRGMPAAERSA